MGTPSLLVRVIGQSNSSAPSDGGEESKGKRGAYSITHSARYGGFFVRELHK